MSEKNIIIPRKLAGFMELAPHKQVIFDDMISKIREVYKNACFLPLDTPVLELSEILLAKSGGEIDKEVYNFKKGDTDVCMRYDLTVPLARFVAMNANELSFPFKRFQIGKVFRGEKAQKGRFREFFQCDADIIGNETLPIAADAECIHLIHEVFHALNLDTLIQVSNRNILFGLIEEMGYESKGAILTILDKINKIGIENAKKELKELNVSDKDGKMLVDLVLLKGSFEEVLSKIENISKNEIFLKGYDELKNLNAILKAYKVPSEKCILHLGIIRGQDYYTGTIFEAIIPSHPEFGTVCGGGRYDNLAGYFTEKKLPGVGMSIGFTRLFDLLDSNNMLPAYPPYSQIAIIPLGDTLLKCIELSKAFSDASIKCEVNYDERSFKAKLKEANKKGTPFVLIVGEDEVKNNKFTLKNMQEGTQETLDIEECVSYVRKIPQK